MDRAQEQRTPYALYKGRLVPKSEVLGGTGASVDKSADAPRRGRPPKTAQIMEVRGGDGIQAEEVLPEPVIDNVQTKDIASEDFSIEEK